MSTLRRRRPMTGLEVLEQVFQDRDSDDSDIEVGDPESDGEDVANDEDLMRAADDGDDHDDVDANDSQLDVDDSQLDIVLDDAGTSDDDDAGPALPKIPRLDASWTWEKCGKKRVEPQRLNGTRQEEVLVDMPDNPSPSDFFKLYVTDELLDMMALETNKYATQFIADNVGSLKPHSLVHQWKDTDKNEMAVLLGMMLHKYINHDYRCTGRLMSCFTHRYFRQSCHVIDF